uniref:Putative secreted protein n=1 Tax=Anopheles darlingi TaxID=43151 RepID=A0A2M4D967_ANODA
MRVRLRLTLGYAFWSTSTSSEQILTVSVSLRHLHHLGEGCAVYLETRLNTSSTCIMYTNTNPLEQYMDVFCNGSHSTSMKVVIEQ